MKVYPDCYLENVKYISLEMLNENKLKGIILDVDNTLIDKDKTLLKGVEEWCNHLKNVGIKFCILSNSNKKEKIKKVAEKLNIPYISFAKKPLKKGFKKAKDILGLENNQIAVVGDQIFTDVIGANRCKMFSILVKPISKKDIFITVIKRPIENWIIKRYIEKGKRDK